MKKNILIIGFIGVLGLSSGLTSCAPDYETKFDVTTLVVPDKSQAPIIFPLDGGSSKIKVETNAPLDQWSATSNAEWCKLEKKEGEITVSTTKNNIYKQRKAEITIAYGHQSYSITVTQFGNEPVIQVGENQQKDGYIQLVSATNNNVEIPIVTNLDIDNIIIPDTCSWVSLVSEPKVAKLTRAASFGDQALKFKLEQNTDTVVRYCTVILQSSQNYSYTSSFVIKQYERGYIIGIEDSKKEYTLSAMGETLTIPFQTNGPNKAYTYTIEPSAQGWISPAPATTATRGMRDVSESFIIQPNIVEAPRVGYITFRSTDPKEPNEFVVKITQEAFIPVPPVCVENAVATPYEGWIKLNWQNPTNTNYTNLTITYWDKVAKENKEIKIVDTKTTSCIIEDTYLCAGEYEFTIKTYGPTGMETETPAVIKTTSKAATTSVRVTMTLDMLSANATQPDDGGGLVALIDDNTSTYYHSAWGFLSPGNQPHYIQINLSQLPLQRLRFEYDTRNLDNGDVVRAGIWGSETGKDNTWKKIGTHTFPLPTSGNRHSAANENVIADKPYPYIRFTPEARRGLDPMNASSKNNAWFNMGGLYLYKINKHDEAWAQKELGN